MNPARLQKGPLVGEGSLHAATHIAFESQCYTVTLSVFPHRFPTVAVSIGFAVHQEVMWPSLPGLSVCVAL